MTEISEPSTDTIHEFDSTVVSLTMGFMRLWQARIVHNSTFIAFVLLNREDATPDEQAVNAATALRKVTEKEFDGFSYISSVSGLVYATTLLDSFLSDTTMFLFLLHPHSIGDQQSISLGDLLSVTSRAELISAAASKRVREISFLPFIARLDFLRERFGLHIALDRETLELIDHFASVRNVLVHNQSVYDFLLDEYGKILARQVRCPRHPTPILDEDLKKAQQAFEEVAAAVYEAVCTQVLKRHGDPFVQKVLGLFRHSPPGSPPEA